MSAGDILQKVGKVIADNSTTILSGVAVAGVLTTTVLAVRATPTAVDKLRDHFTATLEKPNLLNVTKLVWKDYIPAAVMGTTTIVCIIAANRIGNRRAALLAAGYTFVDHAFAEYREATAKVAGDSLEEKIRGEVAQKKVSDNPVSGNLILVTGNGKSTMMDSLSGRYFEGSVEAVRKAQNDINQQAINEMYASQNDFYALIGIPPIALGDELGWSTDVMCEIDFDAALDENDKPVIVLNYRVNPIRGYYKVH